MNSTLVALALVAIAAVTIAAAFPLRVSRRPAPPLPVARAPRPAHSSAPTPARPVTAAPQPLALPRATSTGAPAPGPGTARPASGPAFAPAEAAVAEFIDRDPSAAAKVISAWLDEDYRRRYQLGGHER